VRDPSTAFFTTPRFAGHLSVLLRAVDLPRLSREELTEIVQDAWLSRASNRRRERWLADRAEDERPG